MIHPDISLQRRFAGLDCIRVTEWNGIGAAAEDSAARLPAAGLVQSASRLNTMFFP
jgi:hypothetical protein